ncbi:MAG: hypothetical protein ACI9TY_001448 [Alphaproteobacteria bacterium]|jgi:hypothetical protein
MANSYSNIHRNYDKSRARVLSLVNELGLVLNDEDQKIFDFTLNAKGPNKDIFMDIARDYFNSKFIIQEEQLKIKSHTERFADFMAK